MGVSMDINSETRSDRPRFSIITPSYNSWKYMEKYLESLEQQTYHNFEVIIVDDCSTDETFACLDNYIKTSSLRFKLFRNDENRGPGFSRNRGLVEASGEWITFVDSDDSVDVHLLEKAESVLDTNVGASVPVNCIVYDFFAVRGKDKLRMYSMYGENSEGIYHTNYCIAMVRNHVIGKFYKAEVVKKIHFPELKRCEDVAYVCQAIDACCIKDGIQIGCTYYLKEALYNYIQRPSSLSNDRNLDAADMIKAYEIIEEKLGKRYPDEICTKSIADLLYGGTLMLCKAGKSDDVIIKHINDYEKRFPNWRKNQIVGKLGRAKEIYLFCIAHKWVRFIKILSFLHSKLVG